MPPVLYRIGSGTISADHLALQSVESAPHEVHRPDVNENTGRRKGNTNLVGWAVGDGQAMMEGDPSEIAPRDRLLEAARKELVDFERRENEFRKMDRDGGPQSCDFLWKRSRFTSVSGLPATLAQAPPLQPLRHPSAPQLQPT